MLQRQFNNVRELAVQSCRDRGPAFTGSVPRSVGAPFPRFHCSGDRPWLVTSPICIQGIQVPVLPL